MFTADRRLPGIEAVRQQWADRANKGRGIATMFDTAYDLEQPGTTDLLSACEHVRLTVTPVAEAHGATAAGTARQAISRTLAVALVAARATGKYHWSAEIDIDQLVTDTAWDHLVDDLPSDTVSLRGVGSRRGGSQVAR